MGTVGPEEMRMRAPIELRLDLRERLTDEVFMQLSIHYLLCVLSSGFFLTSEFKIGYIIGDMCLLRLMPKIRLQ